MPHQTPGRRQPGVTTSPAEAKSSDQVRENAGGAGWRLKAEDLEEIELIIAPIEDIEKTKYLWLIGDNEPVSCYNTPDRIEKNNKERC